MIREKFDFFNIGHTFNKLSEQMNIMIVIGITWNDYITNPGSLITFLQIFRKLKRPFIWYTNKVLVHLIVQFF